MNHVAKCYGQALYDLAKDEGLDTQVLTQLEILMDVFSHEPEYLRLLGTHDLTKEERCYAVDKVFRDCMHGYVLNFLKLLSEKNMIRYFADCFKVFQNQYHADHGFVRVLAVTAIPLTPEQTVKLLKKLEYVTQKRISLETRLDPTCLGGMRLDYEGKRLDGTVKNQLDQINRLLKTTVL